ncbi:MAG: hypothetical protein ACOC78_01980, partial [Actinomycetota bacterium]
MGIMTSRSTNAGGVVPDGAQGLPSTVGNAGLEPVYGQQVFKQVDDDGIIVDDKDGLHHAQRSSV